MNKEDLIKKWLNNNLTKTEAEAFHALEDASLYKEIINESQRFNANKHAKVNSFKTLNKKLDTKQNRSVSWLKLATSLAAILVLGFALFTVLNNNNTIKTSFAENKTINLPDNSRVNLNQLSVLEYNSSDWKNQRTLKLTGEAYFEVEKGHQFNVNTNYGNVRVLGTTFNVLARDSIFKVSCYEGVVQVIYNNNKTVKLLAGSEVTIAKNIAKTKHVTIAEPFWLKNMSVFKNKSLKAVINELEKHYPITVTYPSNLEIYFTGAFEHNHLENALKAITQPLNLSFHIKNKHEVFITNE